MLVGYARVSTGDQSLDLQEDALRKAGCGKLFTDVASGAKDERAGLAEALAFLRPGDTLVVWKLDRLGRSLKHLIETVTALQAREGRLPQPAGVDRHDHQRRQAHLSRLRRPGRVRAGPDPRADPGGPAGGTGSGTQGRTAAVAGREEAGPGPVAAQGPGQHGRGDLSPRWGSPERRSTGTWLRQLREPESMATARSHTVRNVGRRSDPALVDRGRRAPNSS